MARQTIAGTSPAATKAKTVQIPKRKSAQSHPPDKISRNCDFHLNISKALQIDEPAFSLSYKVKCKEFRRCVKRWCNFLKVAILVFLAIWQMDGF